MKNNIRIKLIGLIILFSFTSIVKSDVKSSIEIKTVFQECENTPPVPMQDVAIKLTLDEKAKPEDFQCESKVDSSGVAKCFIIDSCKVTPMKLYNRVTIEDKKYHNLSPNKIELVVEECSFLKPPSVHEVTFSHAHCTNYEHYMRKVSLLKLPDLSATSLNNEQQIALLNSVRNDPDDNVEQSIRSALNLSQIYRDNASLFPEGSQQKKAFKEKEIYFAKRATLAANLMVFSVADTNIPDIVVSSSLSDYYNNMNKLRDNQGDLLNALLPTLEPQSQADAKIKINSLMTTKELNLKAVIALKKVNAIKL